MSKHTIPALSAVGGTPSAEFVQNVLAMPEMAEVSHLLAAANIEITARMSEDELDTKLSANSDLTIIGKGKLKNGLKRAGLLY